MFTSNYYDYSDGVMYLHMSDIDSIVFVVIFIYLSLYTTFRLKQLKEPRSKLLHLLLKACSYFLLLLITSIVIFRIASEFDMVIILTASLCVIVFSIIFHIVGESIFETSNKLNTAGALIIFVSASSLIHRMIFKEFYELLIIEFLAICCSLLYHNIDFGITESNAE